MLTQSSSVCFAVSTGNIGHLPAVYIRLRALYGFAIGILLGYRELKNSITAEALRHRELMEGSSNW